MGWDKLPQIIVSGTTLGSVCALIAFGFSMVYGTLRLLNFAHGDVEPCLAPVVTWAK